ncbi:hypothetical protein P4050_35425 [Pseudomonas aeruginosa]|nr:hypothetical protein [Pseudomonas aeruginosa]
MTGVTADEAIPRDLTHLDLPAAIDRVVTGLCDLKLDMDRHGRGFIGQPFLDATGWGRRTPALISEMAS